MTPKVLLFIPAYNCAPQLRRLLGRLGPADLAPFAEVLVADNGSSDGTAQAAAGALAGKPGLRSAVVRNRENYSLGGSLKVAFGWCLDNGFTHCAVLHGDDQADLRDLLPLLSDEGALRRDCSFGSRFMAGSRRSGYSAVRTLGNFALNFAASLAAGRRITDLGSGLNLYSAAFLADRAWLRFPDRLTFDVYLLLHCLRRRADIAFFPIGWREEDQVSNARAFGQGAEILGLLARHALGLRGAIEADHGRAGGYPFDVVWRSPA